MHILAAKRGLLISCPSCIFTELLLDAQIVNLHSFETLLLIEDATGIIFLHSFPDNLANCTTAAFCVLLLLSHLCLTFNLAGRTSVISFDILSLEVNINNIHKI